MKKDFYQLLFRRLAFLMLLGLFSGALQAQKTIRGTVVDAKGDAVSNVNVVVKGSRKGTATDSLGKFAISAAEKSVLEFSIVGYVRKEVNVGTQPVIDVTLESSSENIAE